MVLVCMFWGVVFFMGGGFVLVKVCMVKIIIFKIGVFGGVI